MKSEESHLSKNFAEIVSADLKSGEQSAFNFYSLIEYLSDGVALSDKNGNPLYQNLAVQKILGWTLEERKQFSRASLMHPEDLEQLENLIKEALASPGKSLYSSPRLKHKNGHYVWAEGTVTNMLHVQGVNAMVFNFRDITDRKNWEEEYFKAEANLHSIFNSTEMAYVLIDPDFKILNFNTIADSLSTTLFKTALSEGKNLFRLLGMKPLSEFEEMAKITLQGSPMQYATNFRHPDKSMSWFHIRMSPLLKKNKTISGICISLLDITEHKNAEHLLAARNEMLMKVNAELDRFVYSASHELRAPLSSILGLIDLAEQDEKEESQKKKLMMMKSSVKKLDDFVKEIVLYSRNSRLLLEKEELDFNSIVDECIENLRYMDGADRIEFIKKISDDGSFVSDKRRITMVINNLLSNAIKYHNLNQKHPQIKISIQFNAKELFMEISDNGIGMSALESEKIFKMFYRISEKKEGSGLGLYIVKETVERLKGKIEVVTSPDLGSTFKVKIPNSVLTN